jgi:hypothetical protein
MLKSLKMMIGQHDHKFWIKVWRLLTNLETKHEWVL